MSSAPTRGIGASRSYGYSYGTKGAVASAEQRIFVSIKRWIPTSEGLTKGLEPLYSGTPVRREH